MSIQENKRNPSATIISDQARALRDRADEKLLSPEGPETDVLGPVETQRLVYELRLHQIELEIQNEDLRCAQEALEASRARFVNLYDFAPAGYVTVSEAGLIIEANLTAATQMGVARSELVRQPLTKYILPEDQDIYYRHSKVLFETGAPQTCELRLLRRDNSPMWSLLKATLDQGDEKGPSVCRVFMTDITERKQAEEKLAMAYAELEVRVQERTAQLSVANAALSVEIAEHKKDEEALRESERKYRTLADHSVDWEYWEGPENEMHYISPSFERITGYPLAKFMDDPTLLMRIVHPEDYSLVDAHRNSVTDQENCALDFRIVRSDGAIRWIGHVCQPVRGNDGQFIGRRASNRDITERKRSEVEKIDSETKYQQLLKAESLGRMAGAIAHHYNNLLMIVRGNLDFAMDGLLKGRDISENLTSSLDAIRRAERLGMMMLSYIGQVPGRHEPLDLSETCHRGLDPLRPVMLKDMDLQVDLPIPGSIIKADAYQIQQMLTNLVTNAREAIGEGRGTIHLAAKTVSPANIPVLHRFPLDWQPNNNIYACLEIIDTGCGIAETDIYCLFDPFYTSKFTGRGLGLPVVLGIVKAHNGAITVESKESGGSTFRVFLPVSAEAIVLPKISAAGTLEEIKAGGAVLVVDDEPLLLEILRNVLPDMGFRVLEARNGFEAVEVFRQHRDDIRCVLCDVVMPRMDGWQTLSALRRIVPDIPVILSSGYDRLQVMAGEHPDLPQAFLGKPYGLKALREAIYQSLVSKEGKGI
jgi:PAS domain S-box-containing protein